MPKAWARVTKHSDCFKSKGHQDWKTAEILCAPLLVCTASSQILNYVFPGKRKRRKKQLKNDAKKKNRTHQSKKDLKKKKNIYQENCAFCFVLFSCFVCFCMLLFCFAVLVRFLGMCSHFVAFAWFCFFCGLCVCVCFLMWFCFCCAFFFPQFVLLFFICFHKRINLLDSRIF